MGRELRRDRDLDIPGIDLPGSHGAAEFVKGFDGHPDVSRDWSPQPRHVGVIGAGNVALDVARVLAKHAEDVPVTEIPHELHRGLAVNRATDVHVFARRGLVQARFTPKELRELDHVPGVEVVVDPEDVEFDEGSLAALRAGEQTRMVVRTLQDWALRDRRPAHDPALRRLHLHFLAAPVAVLGADRVTGLRTERIELDGRGGVRGTGVFTDHPLQALYRATGYIGSELPELPFDALSGTLPHAAGRVLDFDDQHVPGVYACGWIKRGPVGPIGHIVPSTRPPCVLETVGSLLADADDLAPAPVPDPAAVVELLEERGVRHTTWDGRLQLDEHARGLGEERGRERLGVAPGEERADLARVGQRPGALKSWALHQS
ncbi:pyridine nucleotide-disulfide oxidoreductase [Pseudonocardia kujensis]|uniref:pyridine nucleotide-disulfide oxidoreductase n=1 Tax=Pseudonocardia kujensis TaxID=1128675 RepID=UPI001E435E0C|nr:pyridine nucleotide-disulfide oxidoreductase [Pseudonocardia kujensis]MCE0765688.1 pyridine nucleotide-disulfide oxidoreductase [Pseudonocardia kujensis]